MTHHSKRYTEEEVHLICKTLVEMNGDIPSTVALLRKKIKGITYHYVHNVILQKKARVAISDQYFPAGKYKKQFTSESKSPQCACYTDEQLHLICKALLDTDGSTKKTYDIVKESIPNVTRGYITSIKAKHHRTYISDQYFKQDELDSGKNKFNNKEFHQMCKVLLEFDGNVDLTVDYLKEKCNIIVTKNYIAALRSNYRRPDIASLYFDDKHVFTDNRVKFSQETIHLICKTLVKNNGNINETKLDLETLIADEISASYIAMIRDKKARRNVSDLYFTRNQFNVEKGKK